MFWLMRTMNGAQIFAPMMPSHGNLERSVAMTHLNSGVWGWWGAMCPMLHCHGGHCHLCSLVALLFLNGLFAIMMTQSLFEILWCNTVARLSDLTPQMPFPHPAAIIGSAVQPVPCASMASMSAISVPKRASGHSVLHIFWILPMRSAQSSTHHILAWSAMHHQLVFPAGMLYVWSIELSLLIEVYMECHPRFFKHNILLWALLAMKLKYMLFKRHNAPEGG